MKKNLINNIIDQLTLEEKISLLSGKDFWHLNGIERLNIPSIMVTDGPHGLRKQSSGGDNVGLLDSVPSTCFPTASGLASSWDDDLLFKVGEAIAQECLTENVSVILGPGANIKRHPLCGRNFEYFSEDPYLTGKLAASYINGVQSKNIGTSLKHFVANNQEGNRMVVDTIVDERTLREIYLLGFEYAVKNSQPWTVMCSYNKVNGTYLSENKYFLSDILKEEWKHDGIVITDWGANNDRVKGLVAGQELEMPGNGGINNEILLKAVNNGIITTEMLDESVQRILNIILKTDKNNKQSQSIYNVDDHHSLAREISADTIVLLKNEKSILPLKKSEKIALIGEFAEKPRFQGSGSSLINPHKIDNAKTEFEKILGDNLLYSKGYLSNTEISNKELLEDAISVAKKADKVVVMIGLTDLFESEGFDRTHLNIPTNHNELVQEILKVNKNVIVALSNGSPVLMPWEKDVDAILECYLGGQASGGALADVIFGKVNPSGKLAETFPNSLDEFPSNNNFPGLPRQVEYFESIYVGYRYYDSANVSPKFPFGYGLSYTTFKYSKLILNKESINDTEEIIATFKVKNTGEVKGKEVVQVYVKDISSTIFRPKKELKAYKKVELEPYEEKVVTITLSKRDFAYYDVSINDWNVESGNFEISIGSSSRNILLTKMIEVVSSNNHTIPILPKEYYNINKSFNPSKEDFEVLLQHRIPTYPQIRPFTINSTFQELSKSILGNLLYRITIKQTKKLVGKNADPSTVNMMNKMIQEMPFRNFVILSNGKISRNVGDGLILLMNRKIFKGFKRLFKKD